MKEQNIYLKYMHELIKKSGLTEEDGSVDESYAEKMAEELKKRVGLMIMNELSEKDLDAYAKLVHKQTSPEKLGDFLSSHIKDFDEKRTKVFEDFAYNFLKRVSKMREALN